MRRSTATFALALLLQLALAGAAQAHVRLRSSEPATDSTVAAVPRSIVLHFSGPVEVGPGGIQVFDPAGKRVDMAVPRARRGDTVTQQLHLGDTEGTWSVSYRVASEDGHVVSGYVGFIVGSAGGGSAARDASREAAHIPRSLQATFSAARFVEVLALLALAGGGIFVTAIAPGARPRLLGAALTLLLLAYAVGFAANAAILRGTGIVEAFTDEGMSATADTPFGRALTIRTAVTLVAIGPVLLLRSGTRPLPRAARWALALVFAGVAASLSITGHAVTTDPLEVRMPLDMLHVVAAATWIGGLMQLGLLRESVSEHPGWVRRFSRAAFGCVVLILVTGAVATWLELDSPAPADVLDSRYGRLVSAKLLLFLGTIPFAWNNMTAFVPSLEERPRDAPYMLRQYVVRELVLLVAVVAFTVWLIATPQP